MIKPNNKMNQELKQIIINRNRTVRSSPTIKVQNLINNVSTNIVDSIPYETKIKEWLSPYMDLSNFIVYPTNGVTEGINWWLVNERRKIKKDPSDYPQVQGQETGDVLYMTTPSNADGTYKDIPTDIPVILDMAYFLSSYPIKINIPDNVEKIFFSLNKCFGTRNTRTGWMFSREEVPFLDLLINIGQYYNYYAHAVQETIIANCKPDEVVKTFQKYQIKVCNKFNLVPSDVIWLGLSDDPDYDKFKHGNVNRISIAKEIINEYNNEILC